MKMRFALVDGQKTEPQSGLKGVCIGCESETLTKCGQRNAWHWAHKSKIPCDPWWENKTEWHRTWQDKFPREWQEIRHIDPNTGDKHISDITTDRWLVIEFQHSAINPTEAQSREAFYKDMVWVVDGTRLPKDYQRFNKGFNDLKPFPQGIFLSSFPDECFPASWLRCSVPVYFDFQGTHLIDEQEKKRAPLWCLFPGRIGSDAVIVEVSRQRFTELSLAAHHVLFFRETLDTISRSMLLRKVANAGTSRVQVLRRPRRHWRF